MPELVDVLAPEDVHLGVHATSKRQLLTEIAGVVARSFALDTAVVTAALNERERLGSTGVGHGVALPHARLAGIPRLVGLFWRLDEPIEFDAIDEAPVDLVFVLLVPEHADTVHLKALARVARRLREPALRERLRSLDDARAVWRTLTGDEGVHAAA